MSCITEIINRRRSVRNYKETPVTKETISTIIEAGRVSPSACNAQPGRFVAVTEKELINKIVKEGLGGAVSNKWAVTAPVIIVGCAQLDILTHRIGGSVKGIQYHQIDLGISMEHMVLKATEMGLGTCWIGWFKERNIKKILNIPKGWKVIALLTLGYPQDESTGKTSRLGLEKILFFNKIT